jgi:3-oxoadipate enol-lactonase
MLPAEHHSINLKLVSHIATQKPQTYRFYIAKMSQAKDFHISPDTTLHVTISGDLGPALIFLHFWGGSSRTYSQVISNLSPHFRCIAIDFRGWGTSTGPQRSDAYSIKDLANDIENLIPKLDIKEFVLVGHSMGGKVAQLIAGRGQVKGLKGVVLIAPAPPTPLALSPEMKKQQLVAYSSPQSAEFVVRNVLSSSKLDDEVVSMLVEDMVKGNEFARAAWPAYAMAENVVKDVKNIDVPVLVISGEMDRVETSERLKSEVLGNVRGAEMVTVKDSGHLLLAEAPAEVSRLVKVFARKIWR